jgi:L-asparaginase
MDGDTWRQLAAALCVPSALARDVQGVVITHGTDTMEETAYFLHRGLAHRQARGDDRRHAAGHR